MRVLIISSPVDTHFLPMLPLAEALLDAGHDVLVTGQPDVTGPARDAGLRAVTYGDHFHYEDLLGGRGPGGPRPIETAGRPPAQKIQAAAQLFRNHTGYVLPDYLDLARAWEADLVVSDHMDFTAPIVGEVLGIPSVQHRWGVNPTGEHMLKLTLMWLGPMCERLGLNSVPRPTLILDPAPPALRSAEAPEGRPVRPVPHTGGTTPRPFAAPPGRRVAVTLGGHTLDLGGLPLLRRVVDALGRTGGVEAVVSVPDRFRADLGTEPEGVTFVADSAPGVLFPGSDLAIHHGGAVPLLGAAALGVPQLVLPQVGDEFVAGDKVAGAGAALSLDAAEEQNSDARLGDSIGRLLAEPEFRTAAAELKAQIDAMPEPAEVVGLLQELASRQEVSA
ncbi:nucleotide disphospho-sugar-binding domain-containing protein [Streptomyces sp. NPDC050788]|uniref:nucleotide disphospho-sugar-binding domain-containing protein n=1 Tax=Streptomyces sp. NPDC050788 TaxID=3155041 RepID=UPI00343C601F